MDELCRCAAAASVALPLGEPWTAPRSSGRRTSRRSALATGEAYLTGNRPPPGAPLFIDLGKTRGGGGEMPGTHALPCSTAAEAAPLRLAALPGRARPLGSSAGERLMLAVSFRVLFSFVSLVTISMAFDLSNLAYVDKFRREFCAVAAKDL
ncbi:unnamed protein product [Miscanthus lutarioriparius]|uniref:Uncharacterized protein n=1 Tax=Miscanthus lutarioriparius TaxID=422564 RepID=A0A811MYK3_9POAL|nr:unnamed protein product [Miscanthus lutarioriparius]